MVGVNGKWWGHIVCADGWSEWEVGVTLGMWMVGVSGKGWDPIGCVDIGVNGNKGSHWVCGWWE